MEYKRPKQQEQQLHKRRRSEFAGKATELSSQVVGTHWVFTETMQTSGSSLAWPQEIAINDFMNIFETQKDSSNAETVRLGGDNRAGE